MSRARLTALSAAALLGGAALLAGCTEESLTGTDPGDAPGPSPETVEVTLDPSQMSWRDTTFTGYAVPSDGQFMVVAGGGAGAGGLQARSLVRFIGLPDSVAVNDSVTAAIDSFSNASVRLVVDTLESSVPASGITLRAFPLTRSYLVDEATWDRAKVGEPWTTPGGDFGPEIGSLTLADPADSVLADTVAIPLGASTDSIVTAWRDQDGEAGAAVLVDEADARLTLTRMILRFDVHPAGHDTTFTGSVGGLTSLVTSTFIYQPDQPSAGTDLRLGGLPASRFYFTFEPPDTAGGVPLKGSTINRAELVFRPLPPPASPFRLGEGVVTSLRLLEQDPFQVGPKTPIGRSLALRDTVRIRPDSLAAGRPFRLALDTALMRRWSTAPADSFDVFRLTARLQPDPQAFGFWEFGSAESPAAQRPSLRMLVTPPADFEAP